MTFNGFIVKGIHTVVLEILFSYFCYLVSNYRRLVDDKNVKPSFEEFAAYLKYLTEKQKLEKTKFPTVSFS